MELNDYIRGSKQLCVSVSLADAIWLKKSNFSPSRLLRKAIKDLMNNKSHDDLLELSSKVENMSKLIQQQAQFVQDNNLSEKFGHFQDRLNEEELMTHKKKKEDLKTKETAEEEADKVLSTLKE